MKHIPLRCISAALLAAALLAGCGAETATPASDAAPASVSAAASTPEDRPAQKKPGQTGGAPNRLWQNLQPCRKTGSSRCWPSGWQSRR